MSRTPIADYALLSDCHSAALVSRTGSVDWLCFPRFDGPSVFGRILGDEAGHWSIAPAGPAEVRRRYRERTMVLETEFLTASGRVTLTDAMVTGPNPDGHELGERAPHTLVRVVSCDRGRVDLRLDYVPRLEYGLVQPVLLPEAGGVRARGGASRLVLTSSVPLEEGDEGAAGTFTLRAGQRAAFALQHRASWEPRPEFWKEEDIAAALEETAGAWRSWSASHQNYEGPWRDLVYHSGSVLQALTFQPTGAIVAAPTTSLPESVGGVRNWDYRYAWVRDATLTMEALWVAACPDEARDFFDWMTFSIGGDIRSGRDLQTMFGVGGEHDLTERELSHLPGWRNSRPVRVGNGAWVQRQLDVYGELLSAAQRLSEQVGDLDRPTRQLLVDVADAAADLWRQPDQGLWEMRAAPRHFLHSKLMCWVALDRAVALAPSLGVENPGRWTRARSEIRAAILRDGWSEEAGAFGQSFGSPDLDASSLLMPIVGFLPADDPRMLSTIEAIEKGLTDDHGLVYRYLGPDGLAGEEGTFLLCTFWLAHAWALAGRVGRSREVFERAVRHANDVGLLAEQVDSSTGELLGNFPQAYSHIGLVNAAWAIGEAEREGGPSETMSR
ncbi:MAG TPA: glycoside hydrolase family 15 protein [Actinomycetota bacterium]|nr:glycoside hydrolase family 15 protein [Actinomycetota bacterium]